jgi:glycosyltransferase involved in cell wall biosynthesis
MFSSQIKLKNLNTNLHFDIADAGLSPTKFQASTFPAPFRDRIEVIHEGVDTDALISRPDIKLQIKTKAGLSAELTRADEVVTFVNRELEPYRGYHVFMRALPELLKLRPNAKFLLVGGTGVSYGARPDPAVYGERSWAQIFADEVMPKISIEDRERIFFLGKVPYQQFIGMLQLSRVHVYLTYPFALSWSLMEAMSIGCAIVGSDTAPVREVIEHDRNGRLVNFFDIPGLVNEISALLAQPDERQRLGANARAFARENYDLKRVCLPRQIAWLEGLVS